MGAVHFSIDPALARELKLLLDLDVFVETGTYEGDSVRSVLSCFEEIHTVELDPALAGAAREAFAGDPEVSVIEGESPRALGELVPKLADRRVLFWLDAHWCTDDAAGSESTCPLLEEIEAIGALGPDSVILVDDARLFMSVPPASARAVSWPRFDQVVAALWAAGGSHALTVIDDVLVLHPERIREQMERFSRLNGSDLLTELNRARSMESVIERVEQRIDALAQVVGEDASTLAAPQGVARRLGAIERRVAELSAEEKRREEIARQGAAAGHAALWQLRELRAEVAGAVEPDGLPGERNRLAFERILTRLSAIEAKLLGRGGGAEGADAGPAEDGAVAATNNGHAMGVGDALRLVTVGPDGAFARGRTRIERLRPDVRLGVLEQHRPIRLRVPRRYGRARPPAPAPVISVVTPSFNQARWVGQTVESVLRQDYPALEYVVQDGGSGDGSEAILRGYSDRLHRLDFRPDDGQAHAINLGFAGTSGELMAYLNSDDLLLPGSLAYVAAFMHAHPEVDAVYGHRVLIDPKGREIGRWVMPPHDDEVLRWADYIPQETLVWRRDIWERAGGRMDESFSFALDWDLLLRFQEAGARIVRLPRFLGAFRVHQGQKTSAGIEVAGAEEMAALRRRELGFDPGFEEINAALDTYLHEHVRLQALYRSRLLRH